MNSFIFLFFFHLISFLSSIFHSFISILSPHPQPLFLKYLKSYCINIYIHYTICRKTKNISKEKFDVNVKQERKERKFSDSDNPIKIEKFLFFSFLFFLIVLLSNINNVTEKVRERKFFIATKQKKFNGNCFYSFSCCINEVLSFCRRI